MRKICLCVCMALLLTLAAVPAAATETEAATETARTAPVEIYTVEDLQQMAQNPTGSYILMNDLDMEGIAWKSLDFSGSFDGNGYAILNLTLSEPGDARPDSVDGNRKKYETAYVGFFGTLQDAQVKDLKLLGLRALVESDEPCFLGGIAGYISNSTVSNCSVSGILELRAHDRMLGVGGLAGYGAGYFDGCTVDVTLICTDTDQTKRDEQFMGGILANGYADITNCQVKIDGYCSEYGYCHNGGLVGMLMQYPWGKWSSKVMNNTVTGKITFFEKNTDRRAYCAALIGEALTPTKQVRDNTEDFLRDERKEYDVELRPEMCENPVYTDMVTAPDCDSYGYTSHTCDGCGYTYLDSYTLPEHIPGEWTLVREATVEETGLWQAYCPCGREFSREEPKLDPPPTTEPAPTEEETVPVQQEDDITVPVMTVVKDASLVVILLAVLAVTLVKKFRSK